MPNVQGYNFHDVGKKMSEDMAMPMDTKEMKNKVHYPSFQIDGNKVPELKNYNVGDAIQLVIKGAIVRKSMREDGKNNSFDVEVDVHSVGASGRSKAADTELEPKSKNAAQKMGKEKLAERGVKSYGG